MAGNKPGEVVLKNVVLSYAHVVDPDRGPEGTDDPKWRTRLMIDPEAPQTADMMDAIEQAIVDVAKEKWGKQWEKKLPPEDRLCFRQMDEDDEYFPGWWFVQASTRTPPLLVLPTKGPDGRWQTLDPQNRPADKDKALELFYSGARVNAVVQFWAQDNKFGRRINAFLNAVQFRAHGERLGGVATPDVDSVFSDDDVEAVEFDETDYEDPEDGGDEEEAAGASAGRSRLFGRR